MKQVHDLITGTHRTPRTWKVCSDADIPKADQVHPQDQIIYVRGLRGKIDHLTAEKYEVIHPQDAHELASI